MIFAQLQLASNSWEFLSLLAGMAYLLVRQYLGDKVRAAGIKDAKAAAIEAKNATAVLAVKTDEQHAATNSRLSELIESIKKEQYAQGLIDGEKNERERVKAAEMKSGDKTLRTTREGSQ